MPAKQNTRQDIPAKHSTRLWDAAPVLGLQKRGHFVTCPGTNVKGEHCGNLTPPKFKKLILEFESLTPLEASTFPLKIQALTKAGVCSYHQEQSSEVADRWGDRLHRYVVKHSAPDLYGKGGDAKIKTEDLDEDDRLCGRLEELRLENASLRSKLAQAQQDIFGLGGCLEKAERDRDYALSLLTAFLKTQKGQTGSDERAAFLETKKRQKEADEWAAAWKQYKDKWLKVPAITGFAHDEQIPWPTKLGTLASMNEQNVREFFQKAPRFPSGDKEGSRKVLPGELFKWHPDQSPFPRLDLSRMARDGVKLMEWLVIILHREAK